MKLKFAILLLMIAQVGLAQHVKTFVYKTIKENVLTLDVYFPESAKIKDLKPVIILFHGGGLVGGNKNGMKNQCSFFAKKGLVAVTASYRLLPKNSPASRDSVFRCIEDAKSAIRWIKLQASELGIDTNIVILGGGSAGGFLATEAALNPFINSSGDNFTVSTSAKALVLFNPAYTPIERYGPDILQFVNHSTPPSIVFYGSNDKFKPGGMSYLEKLNNYSINNEKWIANNETHGYYSKPEWETLTNKLAYNFLIKTQIISGTTLAIDYNSYLKPL